MNFFTRLSANVKAIMALLSIVLGGAGVFAYKVVSTLPETSTVMRVDNMIDSSLIPNLDVTSDAVLPDVDKSSDTALLIPPAPALKEEAPPATKLHRPVKVGSSVSRDKTTVIKPAKEAPKPKIKPKTKKNTLPAVVTKMVNPKPQKNVSPPSKAPKKKRSTPDNRVPVTNPPSDRLDRARARFNHRRQGFSTISYSPAPSGKDRETSGSASDSPPIDRNVTDKWDIPGDANTYPTDLSRVITKEKFIYATLNNRIVSTFSGRVLLTISQNIYGSHGNKVLIPIGTKASGTYGPIEKIGIERLFVHIERMVTPDGQLILFKKASTLADQQGAMGITGDIDNKYLEKFGLPLAFSVANNTVSLLFRKLAGSFDTDDTNDSDLSRIFTEEWAENQSETNQKIIADIIQNNINIMPTISIEPGQRIILYLERDIFFKPDKNGVTRVVTNDIPSSPKSPNH